MKNIGLRVSIIGLVILLSAVEAFAGDSRSISMSCTIPAIPGVNVPLIEEKTLQTEAKPASQTALDSQKEIPQPAPAMIQQDTQEEKAINESQKTLVMVKTLYSR